MRMNLGGRVNDKRTPNYEGSSDIGLLFRDIYWAIPMSGVGIMDGKGYGLIQKNLVCRVL